MGPLLLFNLIWRHRVEHYLALCSGEVTADTNMLNICSFLKYRRYFLEGKISQLYEIAAAAGVFFDPVILQVVQ